ncbi:MAG: ABC transporter permease [Oscillospiraceae bacterium]|nr:ABC transporter permease [Oscillospiraceae bacterium]
MAEFISSYGLLLAENTVDTLYMSLLSTAFSYILGLPMGVLLYTTKEGQILENRHFNAVFGWVINIVRSFPFIILIITVMPLTRLVIGKAIGPTAAIFPLTIGAAPFVARMVESSLEEIDKGVIEACQCMGAAPMTIIRVLLSESKPSIIRGLSITSITLIGYSAIAGAVGAGGLGDIAIRYGYHRRIESVMWVSVILIIIIVCILQTVFDLLARKSDKRNIL